MDEPEELVEVNVKIPASRSVPSTVSSGNGWTARHLLEASRDVAATSNAGAVAEPT